MRACYICGKIDVLNSCVEAFLDNCETIKNLNYFAGISVRKKLKYNFILLKKMFKFLDC